MVLCGCDASAYLFISSAKPLADAVLKRARVRELKQISFFHLVAGSLGAAFASGAAARIEFAPERLIGIELIHQSLGGALCRRQIVIGVQGLLRVLYGVADSEKGVGAGRGCSFEDHA